MKSLLALTDGDLRRLASVDGQALREALRPTGLIDRRAKLLSDIGLLLDEDPDLVDRAGEASIDDGLRQLTALPGVGLKTAKCVLMYSYGRPVLPTDIHVLRVAKRLALVPMDVSWAAADRQLENLVPDHLKYDVHVRFVWHGRMTCVSQRPACERCSIANDCPSEGTAGAARATYV